MRHIEITFLDVQGTVGKHIKLASESEVLTVGWDELQMIAEVAVHIHRIFYIIMIEADGCSAERRWERILEQSHVVIVDIHIGKDILDGCIQDFSGLDHLSDTIALLTLDDILFALRVLAIYVLRNGLIDAYRQGELAVIRRKLYLVEEILSLAEELALHLFLGDIIECKGDLLIFIILIIIIVAEVALLLGSDDTSHEFHGRVILALVSSLLRFHHDFSQLVGIVLELDFEEAGFLIYLDRCGLVAQSTDGKHQSRLLFDGKLTFSITGNGNLVSLVLHACIRYGKAVIVDDTTCYLLLRHHLECRNHQEDEHQIQFSYTFHYLIIYIGALRPLLIILYIQAAKL